MHCILLVPSLRVELCFVFCTAVFEYWFKFKRILKFGKMDGFVSWVVKYLKIASSKFMHAWPDVSSVLVSLLDSAYPCLCSAPNTDRPVGMSTVAVCTTNAGI